jgi:hypothetical protein
MERPGGGPFLRDVCGVLMGRPKAPVVSPCRGVSSSGPLAAMLLASLDDLSLSLSYV